jgi:hypothetical protein
MLELDSLRASAQPSPRTQTPNHEVWAALLCAKGGKMARTAEFNGPSVARRYMTFHMYQPKMWHLSTAAPLTYSQELP